MVAHLTNQDTMSAHVADIEAQLHALETAFATGDSPTIEQYCEQLQRSLVESLVAFRKAEHEGISPLSDELRNRLKLAQARIESHQLAVHRAGVSIDRTLNVLFPRDERSTYDQLGQSPGSGKLAKAYR